MSTRMSAPERRELVLAAATRAFARTGYTGTSTADVAREAGVSQPYVVRIFGTKLDLFLEVLGRAADRIRTAFEQVLDSPDFDASTGDDLGQAYAELVADRDLLQVLMHGFSAGGVDEIAAAARTCLGAIVETLTRTGWDQERVRDFLAHGMLLNVLLAMRAPEHLDEQDPLAALTTSTFGDMLPVLRSQ